MDGPYDRSLPDGKNCSSCAHVSRCCAFGFSSPNRVNCDFFPSRYVPSKLSLVGQVALSIKLLRERRLRFERYRAEAAAR